MSAGGSKRRARRRDGFTLIEVMVSLGIMTIAAMTMIALQQHVIRANSYANQVAIATQIAQQWVERMKQDAHAWNEPATSVAGVAAVLNRTNYLIAIGGDTRNRFRSPVYDSNAPLVTNVYDFRGTSLPQEDEDLGEDLTFQERVFFCSSVRQAWVYFGRAMRLDVRVYWPREGAGASIAADFPGGWCQDSIDLALSPGQPLADRYHVIYMSTVIRMNPVVR